MLVMNISWTEWAGSGRFVELLGLVPLQSGAGVLFLLSVLFSIPNANARSLTLTSFDVLPIHLNRSVYVMPSRSIIGVPSPTYNVATAVLAPVTLVAEGSIPQGDEAIACT